MTIEEALSERLHKHGLWPEEIKTIMGLVKQRVTQSVRWDNDTTMYPAVMGNILWVVVKKTALEWLRTENPMHFARNLLDEELPIPAGQTAWDHIGEDDT